VRDDSHQFVLVVDDWNGDEVVVSQFASDDFLIVVDPHRNHVPLHDVGKLRFGIGQNQLFKRNEPVQAAGVVEYVNVVNRFDVGGLFPQPIDRLGNVDVLGEPG